MVITTQGTQLCAKQILATLTAKIEKKTVHANLIFLLKKKRNLSTTTLLKQEKITKIPKKLNRVRPPITGGQRA